MTPGAVGLIEPASLRKLLRRERMLRQCEGNAQKNGDYAERDARHCSSWVHSDFPLTAIVIASISAREEVSRIRFRDWMGQNKCITDKRSKAHFDILLETS